MFATSGAAVPSGDGVTAAPVHDSGGGNSGGSADDVDAEARMGIREDSESPAAVPAEIKVPGICVRYGTDFSCYTYIICTVITSQYISELSSLCIYFVEFKFCFPELCLLHSCLVACVSLCSVFCVIFLCM